MVIRSNAMSSFKPFVKVGVVYAKPMRRSFQVKSLEGAMRGRPGDYLCVGPAGERWVVRREIFEATYQPAQITRPSMLSEWPPVRNSSPKTLRR
ncbi:MAG: hypothetical protein DMD93_12560 [Candidatus Rokuibacteriota bacterium]|nr:MAG: hypothetical protein DMD93_12560 [Candidatus Rokubacteria bacterium]